MHKLYQVTEPASPRWSRVSIIMCLMLWMAFVLVTRPSIHGNDGVQNYAYLHSVLFDRDLDFTNEYDYYMSQAADWFNKEQIPRDPVTNLPINLYGVGSSLLWTPWVLAAHAMILVANALGVNIPADGFSAPYGIAVGYASCFYATLGLWLLYRFLRRRLSEVPAAWAILLLWLATPLFFYMYLHPSMSHANSFLMATLVLIQYLDSPRTLWRWGLLGLSAGLMVLVRFQDGILLLGLAAGELWYLFHEKTVKEPGAIPRHLALYAVFMVGFILPLTLQFAAWHVLQGSWFSGPRAYVTQGQFSLLAPTHVPQVLFSSNHGLFYWHPALLIAVAGLLIAGNFLREKLMALAAFTGQTWVIASWSIWWGGASFGQRMFISTLSFLAIGAATLFARESRFSIALKVILLVLIAWNFGCVVQYGLGWIPRQTAVPFTVLLHNNLVRLPALVLSHIVR